MTTEELRERAKALPCLPGIYLMKDKLGGIIYVGKSKTLKKRVSSYFGNRIRESDKLKRLVTNIDYFEYQVTDTELDALLLECKLIKSIKPIYNTLLKNDKKYRFIWIDKNRELPRIEVACERENQGEYYGPYDIPYRLDIGVEAMNSYYKLPLCKTKMPKKDCLAYLMEKCMGPCEAGQDKLISYEKKLSAAAAFLEGNDFSIIPYYEEKMQNAAEKLEFEKAVQYRDYIAVLKMLSFRKEAIQFSMDNKISTAFIKVPEGGLKFYLLTGNRIIYTEKLGGYAGFFSKAQKQEMFQKILEASRFHLKKQLQPRKYLEKGEVDEVLIIYYYLKTNKDSYYESIPHMKTKELKAFIERALKFFGAEDAK